MALHFSKQEFLQRKTKVLQSMKEQILIVFDLFIRKVNFRFSHHSK